jgi:hypothetical protein
MAAAPTPAAQALLGALADRPGATASELLATLAADGRVLRQPGGLKNGRRTPDRWTLPIPAPTQEPGAPSSTTSPAAAGRPPTGSGRLRPGALRELVLACLAERPGQALSPTAIAKTLDRSAGAVANALRVLAGQGAVAVTQAKPRRYTIAPAGSGHADTSN